jgi:uncharacterized protein YjdB
MKRKFTCIFLALMMIFTNVSYIPGIGNIISVKAEGITTNAENNEKKQVISDALEKLRGYYSEQSSLDYIPALAYNYSSDDLDNDLSIISNKLRIYSLKRDNVYNCYKGIMGAVAAGQDPRNFQYKGEVFNYVTSLSEKQDKETGSFNSNIVIHAYCMLALDMVEGEYDKEKAVKILKNALTIDENKAYINEDLEKTAKVMLALSNHKDMEGVKDLLSKCVNYIKSKQKDDGGFHKDNPHILGPVIQALIAVGEDPLSGDYVKNEKTMLDVLMEYQMKGGVFTKETWYKNYHEESTEAAFAALADLAKGKSMYQELSVEIGEVPSKIILKAAKNEIIKGKTLKIRSKVLDNQDRFVPGQKLIWTSSNENIAVVQDGVVTAKNIGEATITAEVENTFSVKQSFKIKVVSREPSEIKIYLKEKEIEDTIEIKKDEIIKLTSKAFDQDGDEIEDVDIKLSIAEGTEYISIDKGNITGMAKGNSVVKVQCGSVEAKVNIKVILITDVIQSVLDEVKTYCDNKSKYNYLEALTLNYIGVDKKTIREKIEVIDKPAYSTNAEDYAKNIISLIAAGEDPRDYNGTNYVELLVQSQKESGYFDIGSNYTHPENIILPVIALDMAGAEYNVDKAMSVLKIKAKVQGSNKCFEEHGDYNRTQMTAMGIIAMSKHIDIEGISDLLQKCKAYLKYKQSDNGAFVAKDGYYSTEEENCIATASAIQALIVAGDNPLTGEWVKNEKNVFDALLSFRKGNEFKKTSSDYSSNANATAAAFAALADMVKNKSMFNEIKVEVGTVPDKLTIICDTSSVKEGRKIKLRAKVIDKEGRIVPGQEIQWTSSQPTAAVVDEKGFVTGKDIEKDETVKITVQINGTEIKDSKDINVIARIPNTIQVNLPKGKKDNNLKEGSKLVLISKVLEKDEEEIDYEKVTWKSSDEKIAVIDETGCVTAKEVEEDTKVTITAVSKSKEQVKGSIELNIIAIIPKKIKISYDDKEIDSITIESRYKLKLEAEAFEEDKTLIDKAEIEWTSSNKNVAIVDGNGLVTAKEVQKESEVKITAKVQGFQAFKILNLKVIPKQSNKQKTLGIIEELKTYYETVSEYDYMEAMVLNRADISEEKIQQKLSMKKPNFKTGYWGSESDVYAKFIMGLIAGGFDPRDYEGKDYVAYLANSQVEEGYFDAADYSYSDDDDAGNVAYSIIALDMAGAEYNVDKALEFLMSKFYTSANKAYIKKYSSGDLEKTYIALIALSKHEDKKGVLDLINKVKVYMEEQYKSWDDKTSSIVMANTIQGLIAAGEKPLSEKYIKLDQYGNKLTMLDMLLKLKEGNRFKEKKNYSSVDSEATAFAFGALTDISTGKSMFKEIKIEVGDPEKVEITSDGNKTDIKEGKKLKLNAKPLDKDNKFVPSQEFIWSSSDENIAVVDENTGKVTAKAVGNVVITAKVKEFESVKNTIALKVIPVTPNKIEVKVDKGVSEIETGKKIKINANVYDTDNDTIENPHIKWTIIPEGSANIDENNILTALKEGKITVTAVVKKADTSEIKAETKLQILKGKTKEERIEEAIKAVQEKFQKQEKSYDYMTSMALRYTDVSISDIAPKMNIYGTDGLHNNARNIMNIIAGGENPKEYKYKNYVDLILNADKKFYKDSSAEYIAKAIIALEMTGAKYDKEEAVKALISKLQSEGDKLYIKGHYRPDIEKTAWVLIALSNHKQAEGVIKTVEGIKKFLKENQGENGLIESCLDTSIVIQALMAINEDPLSEQWTKCDEYGNKITLLDILLSCRDGGKFRNNPESTSYGYNNSQFALAALGDLNKGKSMYHQITYLKIGEPKTINIKSDDLKIVEGEEVVIFAEALDENNMQVKGAEIVWKAVDPAVVEVKDGKVKALKVGETKVRAELKGNEKIYDEITVKVNKSKDINGAVKASINNLIRFYDKHGSYDYMSALAMRHLKGDFSIDTEKVASNLRLYTKDFAIHYAKNIMEIIAAGKNPGNYPLKDSKGNIIEYKDYLGELVESQKETGEFLINSSIDKDSIVTLSLSIMALDMAGADYKVEAAVNRLVDMLKDGKHEIDGLYREVETRAIGITALSRHKNIAGVKEIINTSIEYIKSKQNDKGGFDRSGYTNNPFTIGTVIQALIANDIDPMSWVKNDTTMVEVLIERQLDNGGFEYGEQPSDAIEKEIFDDFKCTETAFAALSDFYNKKSMYKSIGVTEELKKKIKDEIEFLKKHYEVYYQFEFLALPAANLSGMDRELIQGKIFEYNSKTYSAWETSKTIVALIGAGLNPRHYEIEDEVINYVYELKSSQVKSGENKGEFILVESRDKNSIEALAYSIMALDMSDAKYDKEAAVKRLLKMIKDKNSDTYKEITTEALVLTVLAKHKSIEGVKEEINALLDFLKSKQNSEGGFDIAKGYLQGKNSSVAAGRVIQGLVANGINPLYDDEWIKNGNTIFDALLKCKIIKDDFKKCGYAKCEGDDFEYYGATLQGFAAVVDLYNNESMFNKLKVIYDGPTVEQAHKINLKKPSNNILFVGKTLELKADVIDKDGNIIEEAEIQWISSNEKVATIKDEVVTALEEGEVEITAKLKDKDIKDTFNLVISKGGIKEVKVISSVKALRPGDKTKLSAKAFDQSGDEIAGKQFEFITSDENIAVVDNNTGEVTAVSSGTVVISALLKDGKNIKADFTLKVVPKKQAKVFVRIEGKNKTILDKTEVLVDNFDMNPYAKTEDKGPEALKEPTAAHAVVKALENEGYDCKNEEVFAIKGFYLSKIGEDKADTDGSSGWMYRYNGIAPSYYMEHCKLKDGDTLLFYYVQHEKSICTELTADKLTVKVGDKAKLTLKDIESEKVVSNALIHVDGQDYKVDGKPLTTDSKGNSYIKFNTPGKYKISAVKTEKSGYFIKPEAVEINVLAKQGSGESIDKIIQGVKEYYDKVYFRQNQGHLKAWETAALKRAGVDLSKWDANEKCQPEHDTQLKNTASIINQILILLDVEKDPTNYRERNLVEEIRSYLEENNASYSDVNYIMAVIAIDRFNETYTDKAVDYDVNKAVEKILAAQTSEGGFKQRGDSPVPRNTGYALTALSKHKDVEGVDESIDKALNYLKSIQKEDGGFYDKTYITGYHAEVIMGLVSAGEDLTSEQWTKSGKNPVDALFKLWKENNSFDNKERESTNNKAWIEATWKALYALVDLKNAGYGDYCVEGVKISDHDIEKPAKICDVYTSIVVKSGDKFKVYSKPEKVRINSKKHHAGLTVLGALQATTILFKEQGGVVREIYGIANKGMGGWMYTLNGEVVSNGADKAVVEEGDKIIWFYSPQGTEGNVPSWDEIVKEAEKPVTKEIIFERVGDERFKNNEEAQLKIKVENISDNPKNVVLITGLYDVTNKKMIKYTYISKIIKGRDVETLIGSFIIPEEGEYIVKGMVWDDMDNIKALDEPIIVEVVK